MKFLKEITFSNVQFLLLSTAAISFWPLNFYLTNNLKDTLIFITPSVIFLISYSLISKNISISKSLVLTLPFINPNLLLVPFLFYTIIFFISKNKIVSIFLISVSLIVISLNYSNFYKQTIFPISNDDLQNTLRKIYLYEDIYIARLFQNKLSIILDKFYFNFFALVDINNYFFNFHPREIVGENQNLPKFPFIFIIPFLISFINISKIKNWKIIIAFLLAAILNLSILKKFDHVDFLLFIPLTILILHGFKIVFSKRRLVKIPLLILMFLFTVFEYLYLFAKFQNL